MGVEDTIDLLLAAIIAIVIGYVVYQISQGTQAVANAAGGYGAWLLGAGALATVGTVAFFLLPIGL
jgi:hypothetical protein